MVREKYMACVLKVYKQTMYDECEQYLMIERRAEAFPCEATLLPCTPTGFPHLFKPSNQTPERFDP